MQLIRPRSADLKFKLPYHGASCYSFLKGQLEFLFFSKQSTSEARLVVDTPPICAAASSVSEDEYPRHVYNRHVHDDCMFYHNFVTRMEHHTSSSKIKLSYDQHMGHEVLCEWVGFAKAASPVDDSTNLWISQTLQEIDALYNRSLGMSLCPALQTFANLPCPVDEDAAALVIAIPTVERNEISLDEKTLMQRLWKKNTNKDVERRRLKMQKQLEDQIHSLP